MIIQESMTLKRKLEILSDAAKYGTPSKALIE